MKIEEALLRFDPGTPKGDSYGYSILSQGEVILSEIIGGTVLPNKFMLSTKEELTKIRPVQIERAMTSVYDALKKTVEMWEHKHNHPNWHLGLPPWYVRFVLKYFKWML